jgi:predicted transcriptional regulator of viral defense system
VPADPALTLLLAHAAQQHGLFTRRQAFDAGMTRSSIDWRIAKGNWCAVDQGVYRAAATPASRRQRLLAACLAGPAVASHRAAAALWGFPGFEEAPIEVSAMRHFRRHAADVVWHESRHLGERSVTAVDGIPITRAARTIVDLGYVVDEATVVSALDDALRRALVTVSSVEETLERIGPRRLGSGVVRAALRRRPRTLRRRRVSSSRASSNC